MINFEVDGVAVDYGCFLVDGRLAWQRGRDRGISRNWTLAESTRQDPKFKAICRAAVAESEG